MSTKRALSAFRHQRSLHYRLIFLASLSVSLNIRTSATRTGPFTFLVMILPFSLPSKSRTRTWLISPVVPVRPIIWITSAGVFSGSSVVGVALISAFASLKLGDAVRYLLYEVCSFSFFNNAYRCSRDINTHGITDSLLRRNEDIWCFPFLTKNR